MVVALALFDSGYLVGSILESFRLSFNLATNVHLLLFPQFLYPGQAIMMSASIFMTVAIAMERYVAVHYPVDYNQVKLTKCFLVFVLACHLPALYRFECIYQAFVHWSKQCRQ